MHRTRAPGRAMVALLAPLLAACGGGHSGPATDGYAATIAALSEPGGYFDTDNLISNERSYLHAISDLRTAGVRGGAYLGVGPGQNFSYIAHIEPEIAFIVDIRRDNVLQHLIYKVLFEASPNRLEFLARLIGRPMGEDAPDPERATIREIVDYLDRTEPTPESVRASKDLVERSVRDLGVAVEPGDLETIARFHEEFIRGGLGLRFHSHGRAPQLYYPTLRDLVLEVDREGVQASYLADEDRYRYVRRLQLADRIIPVVADLAGETGLVAIGAELQRRGLEVTVLYTSNVEFYLFGARTFPAFVENLRALPLAEDAVLIKSYFRGFRGEHPLQLPGYYSTQLVQRAHGLLAGWDAGGYRTYGEAVTRDLVTAGAPAPAEGRRRGSSSASR